MTQAVSHILNLTAGWMMQIAAGDPLEDRGTSGRTPCGRVVGIIRRNWRTRGYAGSLQPPRQGQAVRRGAANSSLFCPVERKYPMIRITTRQVLLISGLI